MGKVEKNRKKMGVWETYLMELGEGDGKWNRGRR
jgi:hypothetical protein